MISYTLPDNVNLDTAVTNLSTVQSAFEAILRWNSADVRERLADGNEILQAQEIDEAICEFRKFLMCVVIARATSAGSVGMVSKKVDEVWHNAILFTREYFALSEKILGEGHYLHHAPVVKSQLNDANPSENIFPYIYQSLFGRIPSIWGVRYHDGGMDWDDIMQGICLTEAHRDCDPVCVPDAPCAEDEGQLCKGSVTCSTKDAMQLLMATVDCKGVCNPGDCTTPGQLCD